MWSGMLSRKAAGGQQWTIRMRLLRIRCHTSRQMVRTRSRHHQRLSSPSNSSRPQHAVHSRCTERHPSSSHLRRQSLADNSQMQPAMHSNAAGQEWRPQHSSSLYSKHGMQQQQPRYWCHLCSSRSCSRMRQQQQHQRQPSAGPPVKGLRQLMQALAVRQRPLHRVSESSATAVNSSSGIYNSQSQRRSRCKRGQLRIQTSRCRRRQRLDNRVADLRRCVHICDPFAII